MVDYTPLEIVLGQNSLKFSSIFAEAASSGLTARLWYPYGNDYKIKALKWYMQDNDLFYVVGMTTHVPY